jgi:hypothetical protein
MVPTFGDWQQADSTPWSWLMRASSWDHSPLIHPTWSRKHGHQQSVISFYDLRHRENVGHHIGLHIMRCIIASSREMSSLWSRGWDYWPPINFLHLCEAILVHHSEASQFVKALTAARCHFIFFEWWRRANETVGGAATQGLHSILKHGYFGSHQNSCLWCCCPKLDDWPYHKQGRRDCCGRWLGKSFLSMPPRESSWVTWSPFSITGVNIIRVWCTGLFPFFLFNIMISNFRVIVKKT